VCDSDSDCPGGEDESEAICSDRTSCLTDQFRCERSGECIDHHLVCNTKEDCPDGTDEHGCEDTDWHSLDNCGPGQYTCDSTDHCNDASTVCDGHYDCVDGSDELACGHGNEDDRPAMWIKIEGLLAEREQVNTTTVTVHWWILDIAKTDGIKYQPAYSVMGTNHWIYPEDWIAINDFSYVFKHLTPYTTYNLTVNVMDMEGGVHNSSTFTTVTTTTDIPGPPTITKVEQVEDRIVISWTPPSRPNGILIGYVISMMPDNSEWMASANLTSMTLGAMFEPGKNYSFEVSALNVDYHGLPSATAELTYSSNIVTERVKNLRLVPSTAESTVNIAFDSQPRQTYKVTYKSRNPFAYYDDLLLNGGSDRTGNVTISGLSPNETYAISVSVRKGNATGRQSRIEVTTPGRALPQPIIADAQITPDRGTSIKLTWKLAADEKRKDGWTYGIYYGTTATELLEMSRLRSADMTTQDTTKTISGLDSCESYSFVVCIVGPSGTGQASKVFTKSTKYSPGAPPKNLMATINEINMGMTITWEASCPKVEDKIGYIVEIKDTFINRTSYISLNKQKKTDFVYPLKPGQVHRGTTYQITVQTDAPNSTPSKRITVVSPDLPRPGALTSHYSTDKEQLIYWAPAKNLPEGMSKDVSYRLYLSKKPDFSDADVVQNVASPPFKVDPSLVSPGQIYYVAVALVDSEGYASPRSDAIAIETTVPEGDVVVSKSGVAGVLVPILLVLMLMGSALGIYAYRHRRLKRNFAAFASRYSPASGAAILNQSALDEDDDSPIIRGFSDDEPLVIT
jgi:hypothetical protein